MPATGFSIAALGGGGFLMEPRNPRLDRWLLSLTGRRRPRVLFVPTASGASPRTIARFHRAFAKHECEPSHLQLFNRTVRDLRSFVLRQHVVYVGGGNTAAMLAIWRLHGLDRILAEAYENGALLCGVSAGANCWFEAGLTDSFGRPLRPLHDGLALVAGSFCPHYDGERDRRAAHRRFGGGGPPPPLRPARCARCTPPSPSSPAASARTTTASAIAAPPTGASSAAAR